MLVLSRQRDESIIIGDNILITIVDIRVDKVRLGIQAPKDIPVHRTEIYDAIQRDNKISAQQDLENKANQTNSGKTEPKAEYMVSNYGDDLLTYDPLNKIEFNQYRSIKKELGPYV